MQTWKIYFSDSSRGCGGSSSHQLLDTEEPSRALLGARHIKKGWPVMLLRLQSISLLCGQGPRLQNNKFLTS
jgi:hypothetical protein